MVRCAWLIGTATFILVVFTCQIVSPGVIISIQGDQLTLDVGSAQGVRVGMSGKITKQEMVAGQLQTFDIAKFEVTQVRTSVCMAKVTGIGAGWNLEPGMNIIFDQPLVAPQPTVTPTPRPPAAAPTAQLPNDPVELLRQGNAAWDRQDWTRALEFYGALLRQVPSHPIAAERSAAARSRIEATAREAEAKQRAAERAQREAEERIQREREQREAVERERRNIPLYRETARTYIDAGQWDNAVEWLRKIAAVDPADAYLQSVLEMELQAVDRELAAGRTEVAEIGIGRLNRLKSNLRIESHDRQLAASTARLEVAKAQEANSNGDFGAAWTHLKKADALGIPQSIQALAQSVKETLPTQQDLEKFGDVSAAQGEWLVAQKYYRLAGEVSPEPAALSQKFRLAEFMPNADFLLDEGDEHLIRGDYSKARKAFALAADIAPEYRDSEFKFLLANILAASPRDDVQSECREIVQTPLFLVGDQLTSVFLEARKRCSE